MNYIDYTKGLISNFIMKSDVTKNLNIVVFGPGYNVACGIDLHISHNFNITVPEETQDICNFCEKYRNNKYFQSTDLVIMSRVLEHLPVRNVDWYLYNIATIMKPNSPLICVVPDMFSTAMELRNEFLPKQDNKIAPDYFRANRLTYELLSEGNDVWWRHSLWTDENSVKYYLELEGLFEVQEINKVRLDTDIVPSELEVVAIRK